MHSGTQNANMIAYQSQEAQYNAKVDVVKAEHAKLLQEAFERAKVLSPRIWEGSC